MTYVICRSCRWPHETSYDLCPNCGEGDFMSPREQFSTKIEAEAKAAALWLADGYTIHDVRDPYFNPRR